MTLSTRISDDMKAAMKSGDKLTLETLRTLRAAILEFEKRQVGSTPGPDDELAILTTAAKKRREAIEQYRQAGREDLATQEEAELAVITRYLPAQLSDEELLETIKAALARDNATDMKDLGRVMGPLMKELKGKADGAKVQTLVRSLLGGAGA
jgi:uncharacterized protein YqeY